LDPKKLNLTYPIRQTVEFRDRTSRDAPPAISFSISSQHPFNRAGWRASNVLPKMLSKITKTISGIFLGDPVADTEEIYRTADGKFRIHLGLFRKHRDDTLWLKFVHNKSVMTRASSGIGIAVDTFQHFADFLGSASSKTESDAGVPKRLPLFARIVLTINEGISHSAFLGEYRSQRAPKVAIRLFAFKNRRAESRVIFEHKTSGEDTYEVFDADVLALIQREIEIRQEAEQASPVQPLPAARFR
jgi:hypothetical protein